MLFDSANFKNIIRFDDTVVYGASFNLTLLIKYADSVEGTSVLILRIEEASVCNYDPIVSNDAASTLMGSPSSFLQTNSINYDGQSSREPSLCIAVVGATGELARNKVFPALFALYYSGFLPEVELLSSVSVFFSGQMGNLKHSRLLISLLYI